MDPKLRQAIHRIAAPGFPAHAGMDPYRRTSFRRDRLGFPAHAGMDPGRTVVRTRSGRVSPPTRGWTLYTLGRIGGSPAVSPPTRGWTLSRQDASVGTRQARFPRPRGDGPGMCGSTLSRAPVSPPTRGWTLDVANVRTSCHWVSPPTRGWTHHPRPIRPAKTWGFPAHAGMDPCRPPLLLCARWFPRPRGDGPTLITRAVACRLGFPAHAGMDPRVTPCARHQSTGFPAHAGMDLHMPLQIGETIELVSPPTRGWTPAGRSVCRDH